jgi:hypothetical protein
LGLPFFGLTLSDRFLLFKTLHEICFHSQGGYSWETVYNMPIWLRKLTFNLLKEHYEEKQPTTHEQGFEEPKTVQRPDFRPTYTTKAPKK